jgi:hypothetical protein
VDILLSISAVKIKLRRYIRAGCGWAAGARVAALEGAAPHDEHRHRGKAVQVDPMKPKLRPPGTKRLKLECDVPLSRFAFIFNLHHYTVGPAAALALLALPLVGRCSLSL